MDCDAIMFDLFGTLVEVFSFRDHDRMLNEVAGVLSVSSEEFKRQWFQTYPQRATGAMPTIETAIEHCCQALETALAEADIEAAANVRYAFARRALLPREGAVETLRQLKMEGCRIGLISDCTPDVPHLWTRTPFASLVDAAVFSCAVGVQKPAAKIYHVACERLDVKPERSVFVGDGGSYELTGATDVGMRAVCLDVDYEDTYVDVDYPSQAGDWQGERISSLTDLLQLLQ